MLWFEIPTPMKNFQIYQIKVTLNETHPPIWRRILVPSNTNLLKLHDILQIVMGWEGYHLHMFKIQGFIYGDPEDDEFGDFGTIDEAKYKLSQVIGSEGQRFSYEYDFGDSWDHILLVEKIISPPESVHYPTCLKGKRACPPEDVGGVWGYEHFLEAIADPNHPEHEEYLEWAGGEFDPEAFDIQKVNVRLRQMGRGRSTERLNPWFSDMDFPREMRLEKPAALTGQLNAQQVDDCIQLPLRRNTLALLMYLQNNRVTGTISTGNFPLKVLHAIAAQFAEPLQLSTKIGEHEYPIRSEYEVWPLHFLHILASVAGLIHGGPGRRWKLTPAGETFLSLPAPDQISILFTTWWRQVNWEIASPIEIRGGIDSRFTGLAWKRLSVLSAGNPISFGSFADQLIEDTGLSWPIEDQSYARLMMRSVIENLVAEPLSNFGVLVLEHTTIKDIYLDRQELTALKITSLGSWLLESVEKLP